MPETLILPDLDVMDVAALKALARAQHKCQGRSKTRPVWRSKSRPVVWCWFWGISGAEGLWSVAVEALRPRAASKGWV
jgi:hypothetical protein